MIDPLEVLVRAPQPGEMFRVNPDPVERLDVMLIENEGETYMVAEEMADEVDRAAPNRIMRKTIFLVQNMDGEFFMWPVPAPVAPDHLAYRAMVDWVCFNTLN